MDIFLREFRDKEGTCRSLFAFLVHFSLNPCYPGFWKHKLSHELECKLEQGHRKIVNNTVDLKRYHFYKLSFFTMFDLKTNVVRMGPQISFSMVFW